MLRNVNWNTWRVDMQRLLSTWRILHRKSCGRVSQGSVFWGGTFLLGDWVRVWRHSGPLLPAQTRYPTYTISPGGTRLLVVGNVRPKIDRKKNNEAYLLSVRPPDMLDGVSVLRCWGLMSWLTEGSLLTFPWVGELEPKEGWGGIEVLGQERGGYRLLTIIALQCLALKIHICFVLSFIDTITSLNSMKNAIIVTKNITEYYRLHVIFNQCSSLLWQFFFNKTEEQ